MTPSKMPEPDPREKNLPLYAQAMLEHLRRLVGDWATYAIQARAETRPEDTDTIVHQYSDHPIGLPKGETVTFRLPGQGRREAYVDARIVRHGHEAGWVKISAGGALEIRSEASNCIRLRQVPDGH